MYSSPLASSVCVHSTFAEHMIWMPLYSVPFQNESSLFVDRKGGTIEDGAIWSKLKWRYWVFFLLLFAAWSVWRVRLVPSSALSPCFFFFFFFYERTSNSAVNSCMSVQIRKLHSCLGQILFYAIYAVVLDVGAAASCVPTCTAATSSHSPISFHCVFPCSTPHPQLICSTEWKPFNSVSPSESYPSWLSGPALTGSDDGLYHSKGRKGMNRKWVNQF